MNPYKIDEKKLKKKIDEKNDEKKFDEKKQPELN